MHKFFAVSPKPSALTAFPDPQAGTPRAFLDQPGADPETPVVIQSFSADSLQKMAGEMKVALPLVMLLGKRNRQWLSPAGLQNVKEFAVGIGLDKSILRGNPALVDWARNAGLSITPYTFRSSEVGKGFWNVRAEMAYYLYTLDVDALFTNKSVEVVSRKRPS